MNLKRLVAEELLANVAGFLVSMNVEHPEVELPTVVKLGALRLSPEVAVVSVIIGHRLPKPISDLHVDDEGITATLSFNLAPHLCFMPWDAVVGYADAYGRPIVAFNPEPEVIVALRPTPKSKRPGLRLVQNDEKTSA
jgi:hypothetical protein